jgi:muconolactone D-isomerase
MEFLVRIQIDWPADKPEQEREAVFAAELARGQELAREGSLRRLWRIPGRWANWSLYDVPDATALHDALSSLPLYPWMDIDVHPLAEHPNDPVALGITPGADPEGVS